MNNKLTFILQMFGLALLLSCSDLNELDVVYEQTFVEGLKPNEILKVNGTDSTIFYIGKSSLINLANWDVSDRYDKAWLISAYSDKCQRDLWTRAVEYRDPKTRLSAYSIFMLLDDKTESYCLIVAKQ